MAIIKYGSRNLGIISYDDKDFQMSCNIFDGHECATEYLRYIGTSDKPMQPVGLKDYSFMFRNRKDIETLDLSHWDLSNIIRTNSMFSNCINLKEIIGIEKLDLSNVEDAAYMYWMCTKLVK